MSFIRELVQLGRVNSTLSPVVGDIAVSIFLFIFYLFGVLHRFQHCTDHITTGSWKGRGNQYIQLVKLLYCKLPTNGKQLPAFPPWPDLWGNL